MISVIVPLYNEEEVILECHRRLTAVLSSMDDTYELIFINDGSRDRTAMLAADIAARDEKVRLICFSRNFGHQIAITAGMDYAKGDAMVIIDADLQDPPELIPKMVEKWREGYEVVYGKRIKRHGESFFKKATAKMFYRFLNRMTNMEIPTDTGDFRLIDRKVCDAMKSLREQNRYVRGLVSWVGFRQYALPYVREERFAGKTKYPLRKMLRLASDGIYSFSYKPLTYISVTGGLIAFISLLCLIVALLQRIFGTVAWSAWISILAMQMLLNGIILIALGIVGTYIGRIYEDVKGRPLYIVQETIGFDEKNQ